jgi:hypothetical protein
MTQAYRFLPIQQACIIGKINCADPRHDLDMTSTALVKTCERGHGTTYPGLPWEPKPAFGAVASFYATH